MSPAEADQLAPDLMRMLKLEMGLSAQTAIKRHVVKVPIQRYAEFLEILTSGDDELRFLSPVDRVGKAAGMVRAEVVKAVVNLAIRKTGDLWDKCEKLCHFLHDNFGEDDAVRLKLEEFSLADVKIDGKALFLKTEIAILSSTSEGNTPGEKKWHIYRAVMLEMRMDGAYWRKLQAEFVRLEEEASEQHTPALAQTARKSLAGGSP